MDQVGIAVREARIKELELLVRQLKETHAAKDAEIQQHKDSLTIAHEDVARNYTEQMAGRDERIAELAGEVGGLQAQLSAALAFAREKQDQYDAMCNKLGEQGITLA